MSITFFFFCLCSKSSRCQIEDTPLPHNPLVLLWISRVQAPWEMKHLFPSILQELVLLLLISLRYYYLSSSIISSQSAWNAAEPKEHFTVLHYAQVLRLLGFSGFKFMDAHSLQPLTLFTIAKSPTAAGNWCCRHQKQKFTHYSALHCADHWMCYSSLIVSILINFLNFGCATHWWNSTERKFFPYRGLLEDGCCGEWPGSRIELACLIPTGRRSGRTGFSAVLRGLRVRNGTGKTSKPNSILHPGQRDHSFENGGEMGSAHYSCT